MIKSKIIILTTIIIALTLFTLPTAAQEIGQSENTPHAIFTYDEAGNRVKRHTIYVTNAENKRAEEYWEKVKVYPNPVEEFLQVELPENLQEATLQMVDLNGRAIYEEQATSNVQTINMSSFAKGTYVLYIEHKGKREQWKVVKIN